jgi:hypothetical protein
MSVIKKKKMPARMPAVPAKKKMPARKPAVRAAVPVVGRVAGSAGFQPAFLSPETARS